MSATKTQTENRGGGGKPPTTAAAAPNNRLKEYWQTLVYEWRKISWPEKKQWKDSTIVVFVFTIFLMVVLALFDLGVGKVVNMLLGLDRPV